MDIGNRFRSSIFWLVSTAMLATSISAQQDVGALYGTVTDPQGGALAGASLTLTGFGEVLRQSSDERGKFRYLGLDPGIWALETSLDGYSTTRLSTVTIEASRSTTLEILLTAAIEDVILVTSETPLLDERKLSTGTTLRQVELDKLPIARDPWAILTQSAGVLIDRVDVGGASSSQQPTFRGLAASSAQNDYLLDGIQITDDGGSPTYYDFDQIEELQVLTGGNDVTKNTSGVAISLVTKRGSNEMRGSARFLLTEGDGHFGVLEQAQPGFDSDELGPGQEEFIGNSIDRVQDYGFEGGGPAWRDHIWLWGAWSQREFNTIVGSNDPERFILENVAVKLNAQVSAANSLVASYVNGDKRAFGRGAGAFRDPSSTLNQRGPTGVTKIEDTHLFGSNLYLTGSYGYVDGGFDATAQGGAGSDRPATPDPGGEANRDATGLLTNNSSRSFSSPQEELKLDASYFFNTGGLSHELRFGGRLRERRVAGEFSYPGRNLLHYAGNLVGVQNPNLLAAFGLPPDRYLDAHLVYAYRGGVAPTQVNNRGLWVQDTMTRSRWTVNAGLRYDYQDGENLPATVVANGGFPELMPAIDFAGNDAGGFSWSTFAPRLGLTYALGEERKTLLRASLSQFPDALDHAIISRANPLSGQFAAILFLDEPGGFTSFYDEGETYSVLGGLFGFDPGNPTALSTLDLTDPDLDPGLLTEVVVGVEHAFLPEFVASINLTWRRNDRVIERQPLFEDLSTGAVRTAGASEYLPDGTLSGELPDGSRYAYDTYAVRPGLVPAGGNLLTNGDRSAESTSAAITFTKRLSNRWMARGFVNYIFKEEWNVPASYFDHNDPNRTEASVIDGARFTESGFVSDWQWNLNGMYQVAPERWWGFNIAANLTGRQGYPNRYFRRTRGSDGVNRAIIVVENMTDFRKDDIFIADLRLEKEFASSTNTSLTFSIDGFNIFNKGYVLAVNPNLSSPSADWVTETLSPRIYRLGVRVNWR